MWESWMSQLQPRPLQLLHQRVRGGGVQGGVRQLVLLHGEALARSSPGQPGRDGEVKEVETEGTLNSRIYKSSSCLNGLMNFIA